MNRYQYKNSRALKDTNLRDVIAEDIQEVVKTEAVGVEFEFLVLGGQDTGSVAGMTRVTDGTRAGGLAQASGLSLASSGGCLQTNSRNNDSNKEVTGLSTKDAVECTTQLLPSLSGRVQ